MANEQQGDAAAIIAAMERHGGAKFEKIDGHTIAVTSGPNGTKLESVKKLLDEYRLTPERKSGSTLLTTQDSFVEYTNRHKTQHSLIYVNDTKSDDLRMVVVFNPHKPEAFGKDGADNADFQAVYRFPLSDEWKAWTTLKGEMGQAAFAEFIEEHIQDIGDPLGRVQEYAEEVGATLAKQAKMLDLSRGLAITAEMKVVNNPNLANGAATMVFAEEHKDASGAPLNIPGAFALNIPVFKNGTPIQVPVRLRYRVIKGSGDQSGKVTWSMKPQRLEHVLEMAIKEVEMLVAQKTALQVLRGAP